jgi:GT2 family glycosyltransferase
MIPLVSLVVLGYGNFDVTTHNCLNSLEPWIDDPEIEIIVVDNGSDDDSVKKTSVWCSKHPQVKFLASNTNKGFAGGMNYGASCAQGQWLLLVNNDTIFPASSLSALKRVIQNAPTDLAMIGPVTNAAGNGQRLWKPDATREQWLKIGEWLNTNPTGQLMPTYRCDFFCIAIRRDVWTMLNGLDTEFGLGYYEDFDFSLRLREAGYQQMITEDVFILHLGSATFQGSKFALELIKNNKQLLVSKHSKVKFEHTRLGNLAVLLEYDKLWRCGNWGPEIEARRHLRYGALFEDAPRSLLKRWLWHRKVKRLLQKNDLIKIQKPN